MRSLGSRGWVGLLTAVLTGAAGPALGAQGPAAGRDTVLTFRYGDRSRDYLVHVPPRGASGAPVVLLLHGRLGTGRRTLEQARAAPAADAAGVVVVAPDGVRRSWADGRGATPADKAGVDDAGYLAAVLDDVTRRLGTDPTRRYALGMSNGGFMAQRLACEHAERIAAIGVVVATVSEALAARCAPSAPVGVLMMLGTADPLVPFAGGQTDRGALLSGEASAAQWRRWNGCPDAVATDTVPTTTTGMRVVRVTARGCRGGVSVTVVRMEGAGHVWPGGGQYLPRAIVGRALPEVDGTRMLFEFFRTQPAR